MHLLYSRSSRLICAIKTFRSLARPNHTAHNTMPAEKYLAPEYVLLPGTPPSPWTRGPLVGEKKATLGRHYDATINGGVLVVKIDGVEDKGWIQNDVLLDARSYGITWRLGLRIAVTYKIQGGLIAWVSNFRVLPQEEQPDEEPTIEERIALEL